MEFSILSTFIEIFHTFKAPHKSDHISALLGILWYSLLPRGASLIPAPGAQPPFTLQPPFPCIHSFLPIDRPSSSLCLESREVLACPLCLQNLIHLSRVSSKYPLISELF